MFLIKPLELFIINFCETEGTDPNHKSGLEGLFARPDKDDDEIIRASAATRTANPQASILRAALTEAVPQPARAAISRLARRIEAFQQSPVLLLAPDLELR